MYVSFQHNLLRISIFFYILRNLFKYKRNNNSLINKSFTSMLITFIFILHFMFVHWPNKYHCLYLSYCFICIFIFVYFLIILNLFFYIYTLFLVLHCVCIRVKPCTSFTNQTQFYPSVSRVFMTNKMCIAHVLLIKHFRLEY